MSATTTTLSPLAERMLNALRKLTAEREAHLCGGFTSDDMQWAMGTAFLPAADIYEALDEMEKAGLIRYAGADDECNPSCCYELRTAA